MNEFEKLRTLVLSLTQTESKEVLRGLNVKNGFSSHSKKVVDLILKDIDTTEIQVSRIIYGKPSPVAAKRLFQRLFDKILDILVEKHLILQSDIYDDRSKEVLLVRKALTQADVLFIHGNYESGMFSLEKAIKKCLAFEFYDYLLIALNKKLAKLSLRSKLDRFQEVLIDIENCVNTYTAINKTEYLLRKYSVIQSYSQKLEYVREIQEARVRIGNLNSYLPSVRLRINIFYLNSIEFAFNNQLEDKRREIFKLYRYLISCKDKVTRNDMLMCYLNLANIEYGAFRFSSSAKFLNDSLALGSKNTYNTFLIYELFFLNSICVGADQDLRFTLTKLSTLKLNSLNEIQSRKIAYYNSVYYFLMQEFYKANSEIYELSKLSFKNLENLYYRIYLILLYVEQDRLLQAESQIESLRKQIENYKLDEKELLRLKVIYRILSILVRNSFDFKKSSSVVDSHIAKLCSSFSWKPNSPELIIFEEWFMAKIKGVSYNHKTAVENVKKRRKAMMV